MTEQRAADRRARRARRAARRPPRFFKAALGARRRAAPARSPSPAGAAAQTVTDADMLNFALNLEYLEAQFYSYAASTAPA